MRLVGEKISLPKYSTLVQALENSSKTDKGVYFVDLKESEDRFVPYYEIDKEARKVAAQLLKLGLEKDDRVGICLPTSKEFLFTFFGVQYAGGVPVPVALPSGMGKGNERFQSIGLMMNLIQAKFIVTTETLFALLSEVNQFASTCQCVNISSLLQGPAILNQLPTTAEIGVLQFSSGSTSKPKPVTLLHRNLLAQVETLAHLMGRHTIGASWLPMYHDMGLIGSMLSAVYQAANLVLMTPETFLVRPIIWLNSISKYSASISAAPSFAYRHCVARIKEEDLAKLDLSCWKIALCGGDAVSYEVMEKFKEKFKKCGFSPSSFYPAYGLAESSLAVTSTVNLLKVKSLSVHSGILATEGKVVLTSETNSSRQIVSGGVAVANAEVEIRDSNGNCLESDLVGSIWTLSPSLMAGYFNDLESTNAVLKNGWLDTGDLGFIHEGELYICGRKKDIIIINGSNHSPTEFEDIVNNSDEFSSDLVSVALGYIPKAGTEEELLILIECSMESREEISKGIQAKILQKTGIKPHAIVMVAKGSLPRTSSGKLRRSEALKQYISGKYGG